MENGYWKKNWFMRYNLPEIKALNNFAS